MCLCVWCAWVGVSVCVCVSGVRVCAWVCVCERVCVVCICVCVCWESKPFYHPPHTVRSVHDLNRQCDIFYLQPTGGVTTIHEWWYYNTRVVVVVVGETDAVPPLPASASRLGPRPPTALLTIQWLSRPADLISFKARGAFGYGTPTHPVPDTPG